MRRSKFLGVGLAFAVLASAALVASQLGDARAQQGGGVNRNNDRPAETPVPPPAGWEKPGGLSAEEQEMLKSCGTKKQQKDVKDKQAHIADLQRNIDSANVPVESARQQLERYEAVAANQPPNATTKGELERLQKNLDDATETANRTSAPFEDEIHRLDYDIHDLIRRLPCMGPPDADDVTPPPPPPQPPSTPNQAIPHDTGEAHGGGQPADSEPPLRVPHRRPTSCKVKTCQDIADALNIASERLANEIYEHASVVLIHNDQALVDQLSKALDACEQKNCPPPPPQAVAPPISPDDEGLPPPPMPPKRPNPAPPDVKPPCDDGTKTKAMERAEADIKRAKHDIEFIRDVHLKFDKRQLEDAEKKYGVDSKWANEWRQSVLRDYDDLDEAEGRLERAQKELDRLRPVQPCPVEYPGPNAPLGGSAPPPPPKDPDKDSTGDALRDILGHVTIGVGVGGGGHHDHHDHDDRGRDDHSVAPPRTDDGPPSGTTPHD